MKGFTIDKMGRNTSPVKEELDETPQGYALVQKAKEIAKKMAGNLSGAIKEIEKLQKGLSKNSSVNDALKAANESLEEASNVKYKVKDKDGKIVFTGNYNQVLSYRKQHGGEIIEGVEDMQPKDKEKKPVEEKDDNTGGLEKENERLIGQVNLLKQKLENEKNKIVKPEPNKETGEVPLTVGVAYKHFKDKNDKKEKKEDKKEVKENLSKADKLKRIQRFKDMIKYYTAVKKNIQKKDKVKKEEVEHAMEISGVENEGRGEVNEAKNAFPKQSDFNAIMRVVDRAIGDINRATKAFDKRFYGTTGNGITLDKEAFEDIKDELTANYTDEFEEQWGAKKASGGKHGDKKFKKAEHEPKGKDLEEDDDKAHAIGMAKAKEIMKDEPPLEKKTIKKAHDIAKAIKKDEGVKHAFERMWLKHKRGDKK